MRQRVKVFTYISASGATLIETPLEDHINEWLQQHDGEVVRITQSESTRPNQGHHVTVCIWYVPPAE